VREKSLVAALASQLLGHHCGEDGLELRIHSLGSPILRRLPTPRRLEQPRRGKTGVENIDIGGIVTMPKVIAKVSDEKLLKKMKQYEAVCKKEIGQQIRNHGRLLGLELMHQAQPFSKGGAAKAKRQGEGAIAKDLNMIFIVLNDYWLSRFRDAKESNQDLYRKDGTPWLTDKYRLADTLNQIKEWHKSQRRKETGRPSFRGDKTMGRHKAHEYMVAPKRLIEKAKKELQKAVGWSKAGWAKAAQECKADTKAAAKLSGIPAWIKRHVGAARGTAVDMTEGWWNTSGNPKVVLRSGVSWQSKILPDSRKRNAVNLTRGKFIRFLSMAIKAELKKQSQAK
jgi:hypothetical protein